MGSCVCLHVWLSLSRCLPVSASLSVDIPATFSVSLPVYLPVCLRFCQPASLPSSLQVIMLTGSCSLMLSCSIHTYWKQRQSETSELEGCGGSHCPLSNSCSIWGKGEARDGWLAGWVGGWLTTPPTPEESWLQGENLGCFSLPP